ncbi:hypothetical protein [Rhizobium sp. Nf11,1]|uniref:hypothetical protein n=1 Tax=Rhizobium sp. Nf11,1 TaxID=3404923 RepID=UPI003D33C169
MGIRNPIKRAGELVKEFDDRGRPAKNSVDAVTNISQREAAQAAGMSERQKVTAIRVANVPTEDFERQVESEKPPTVTQLAERTSSDLKKSDVPAATRKSGEQDQVSQGNLMMFPHRSR